MRNLGIILSILFLFCSVFSFSQKSDFKKVSITLTGNNKTRPGIIFREIEFADGDSLSVDDLDVVIEKSKLNLLRTQLFNFVDVTIVDQGDDSLNVIFVFQERWYYWAYPILEHSERNLSSFIYYGDWSRINYGAAFDWYNFRGRDEVFRFKTRLGFKEHYAISYHKPGFGKRKIDGIWVFVDYFRQKKVIHSLIKNQPFYWQNDDIYLKKIFDVGFEYSFRPEINYVFEFGVKFRQYFFDSGYYYNELSGQTIPRYAVPKIGFKYDSRNSIVYPTSGFYSNIRLTASLHGDKDSSNNVSFTALIQQNTAFGESKFSMKNELFVGKYFYDKSKPVLFDEMFNFYGGFFMRGYEYYYFPGEFLFSSKNTLSYELFDFRLNILPLVLPEEFSKTFTVMYLEAFADAAYEKTVNDIYNVADLLGNKFVYSVGIGVSFETYYDRLIQFRVAYNGAFNKFGIFAEFKTPIYKKY